MPLSDNILSLNPQDVHEAVMEFYDKALGVDESNPATRALMHRVANYAYIANKNKDKKLHREDRLAQLMSEIAMEELPPIERAKMLADRLEQHVLTSAYTAHPTNPKSVATDDMLVDVYTLIMMLRNEMAADERDEEKEAQKTATIRAKLEALSERGGSQVPAEADKAQLLLLAEEELKERMIFLSRMPLQSEEKLTVPQEVDRNLKIFGTIFGEFTKTKHRILEDFYLQNGVVDEDQKAAIAIILVPAIARQFQEVHFWSASDADGNDKVTAATMTAAIIAHQEFLDNLYLAEIAKLKEMFSNNASIIHSLDNIAHIIAAQQVVEAAGNAMTQRNSQAVVTGFDRVFDLVREDATITTAQKRALDDLRDQFDCFGLVGPKMDVRQSSVRNVTAMQQILTFLKDRKIAGSEDFPSDYEMITDSNKKAFAEFLRKPAIMDIILANLGEIGAVAKAEIERMIVAKRNPDVVHRYIISDNKGIESWHEVRTLEALALRAIDPSAIPIDAKPLTVYPLCETSQDIMALPDMIRAILSDPESVKTLNGKLHLFLGYSDAEKRGGIFALALMQIKAEEALAIIEEYNRDHPDSPLEVEIFQAEGNDLIRGGPKPAKLTTEQGQGASDHLFKQYWKARLRDAAGNPDDFEKQIEQLRALKPQLRDKLVAIMEASVASFEHFVTHGKDGNGDKLAGFLTSVSMDDALFLTNRSSRAKAKGTGQTELNLDSERAIGLATRFSACGLQANVWQGMATPMADDPSLSELFMRTTVMQDVIYKTVFAIATADFSHGDHLSRAEKAAQIKGVEIDRKMLDKIHASAFDALANVVKFLPLEDEMKDAMLDSIAAAKKDPSKVPANKFAKDIMSQLASEFPVVQELLANVEEHNSHYAVVIHGLLDEYKSADGERRKQLDSDLAVLYREEMRVPEVIAGLTTKTQATRQSHPLAVGSGKKFSEHNLEKQSALVF